MISRNGALTAFFLLLLTIGTKETLARNWGNRGVSQSPIGLEQLPLIIGTWTGTDAEGLGHQVQNVLQLDEYVRRLYVDEKGRKVFVYIGYWLQQSGDHQAAKHSPATCLPANGWKVHSKTGISIPISSNLDNTLNVKRLEASIRNNRQLFYYWFFTGDERYTEESTALMRVVLQKLLHGRSDGGIIELSIPASEDDRSDQALKDFLLELYPTIETLKAKASSRVSS